MLTTTIQISHLQKSNWIHVLATIFEDFVWYCSFIKMPSYLRRISCSNGRKYPSKLNKSSKLVGSILKTRKRKPLQLENLKGNSNDWLKFGVRMELAMIFTEKNSWNAGKLKQTTRTIFTVLQLIQTFFPPNNKQTCIHLTHLIVLMHDRLIKVV